MGAERIYTKTSLAPLVLVDFLPWIDLSRGPALVIANPASDLLGDLYVITPKTSRKAALRSEFPSCGVPHRFVLVAKQDSHIKHSIFSLCPAPAQIHLPAPSFGEPP